MATLALRSPPLLDLAQSRLLFVTGKGGTGKTAVSVGLARALARRGQRVLLVEIDAPRPSLPAYFGGTVDAEPRVLSPRIDGANLDFMGALTAYVSSVVPVKTLVKVVLGNKVVRIFLTATPGARELVLLSRLWEWSWDPRWDHIVVDLPASGHAMALFRCPHLARRAFARGPLRQRADAILERFSDPKVARVLFCALPGELPVNETLETRAQVAALGSPPVAGALLNRFPDESFSPEEEDRIETLRTEDPPERLGLALDAAWETRKMQTISADGVLRLDGGFPSAVGRLPVLPGTPSEVADALSLVLTEWLP
jgi:hypothetical protein